MPDGLRDDVLRRGRTRDVPGTPGLVDDMPAWTSRLATELFCSVFSYHLGFVEGVTVPDVEAVGA